MRTIHSICMCLIVAAASTAWSADKGSSGSTMPMTHVAPAPQEEAKPVSQQGTTMTHFDPNLITPTQADTPQVEPVQIPSASPSRSAPAVEQDIISEAEAIDGFRTPDHLLDDANRIGEAGEAVKNMPDGQFQDAVNDLFESGAGINDLPGMRDGEVDTRDMLGAGGNDDLGKLNDAIGGDPDGLDEQSMMPTPTTPREKPQNAGGGLTRAPTGPAGSVKEAMGGAASHVGFSTHTTDDDGTVHEEDYGNRTETKWHEDGSSETLYEDGRVSETTADGTTTVYDPDYGGSEVTTTEDGMSTTMSGVPGPARGKDFGIDQTQDPENTDPDGKWARWQAGWSGERADLSMETGKDRVINEEDGDSGPAGGNIDLGDSIVVNPDVHKETGQAGEVSKERAAHWKQQLLEGEDRVKDTTEGTTP